MTDGNLFSEKMFKTTKVKGPPLSQLSAVSSFFTERVRNRTNPRLSANWWTRVTVRSPFHPVLLLRAALGTALQHVLRPLDPLPTHSCMYSGSFLMVSEVVFGPSPGNLELTFN